MAYAHTFRLLVKTMKKLTILLMAVAFGAALFVASACTQAVTKTVNDDAKIPAAAPENSTTEPTTAPPAEPDAVVAEFYRAYLKALAANKRLPAVAMSRYLTARMSQEVKDTTDADVVIQGQDYDETWANGVNAKGTEKLSATKSVVTVELKGKSFSQELKVTVVSQANTWKIDSVKAANAEANEAEAAGDAERVQFAKGKSAATLTGSIGKHGKKEYVLGGKKGQLLTATVSSDCASVTLDVIDKGTGQTLTENPAASYEDELPGSGDYIVRVQNSDAPICKFTLKVGIK